MQPFEKTIRVCYYSRPKSAPPNTNIVRRHISRYSLIDGSKVTFGEVEDFLSVQLGVAGCRLTYNNKLFSREHTFASVKDNSEFDVSLVGGLF